MPTWYMFLIQAWNCNRVDVRNLNRTSTFFILDTVHDCDECWNKSALERQPPNDQMHHCEDKWYYLDFFFHHAHSFNYILTWFSSQFATQSPFFTWITNNSIAINLLIKPCVANSVFVIFNISFHFAKTQTMWRSFRYQQGNQNVSKLCNGKFGFCSRIAAASRLCHTP